MMKIKTYIINLKESVGRKDQVLREVSRYPFMDIELVEAVNGRMLMEEQVEMLFDWKNFSYRYGHEPLPGEIGCTLSHRECIADYFVRMKNMRWCWKMMFCFSNRRMSLLYLII